LFRRILIANRGEIAQRIIRACRALDVESVVVFSEADRDAPWVASADLAICIGPARSAASYLDGASILIAAEQSDCQAIHPGYGFLSENARFAAQCRQMGIAFIGPPPAAIRKMGDKAIARQTMQALGVPTLVGSSGVLSGLDEAREVATRVGFPVLLKAVSGGGGKGMRRCADADELERGFAEATLEAGTAFGDSSLYLEKFLTSARHVEFQIVVDARGRAIHLGERDCSIQRKHQKLVEESPSPVVSDDVRRKLGKRVADACAALGYRGAGTVEFLRDSDDRYYFMEMNARLQVEHPVTEMVYGVDLVVAQFRIASGQALDPAMVAAGNETRPQRHAMEFRINAEDPVREFAPDPGVIEGLRLPPKQIDGAEVRWDSAVVEGYRIPPHYDSMIGKLIVSGKDREATLAASRKALDAMRITGVHTTIPFHRRLLEDGAFCRGEFDIEFLQRGDLLKSLAIDPATKKE